MAIDLGDSSTDQDPFWRTLGSLKRDSFLAGLDREERPQVRTTSCESIAGQNQDSQVHRESANVGESCPTPRLGLKKELMGNGCQGEEGRLSKMKEKPNTNKPSEAGASNKRPSQDHSIISLASSIQEMLLASHKR